MTPDPDQVNDLAGILAIAHTNDMTHQETAELLIKALHPAIATALRQARADALEEAKTCALLERGEGDAYPPFWNVCCSKIADHIQALKHKDQK